MNGRRLLRELPIGLVIVATVAGGSYFVHWTRDRQVPRGVVPPAGETFTGEAAAKLHPEVAPAPVDRAQFATLPPECACGGAQLLMHVTGSQQVFSDQGMGTYVTHEMAVDVRGAVVRLPVSDDTAPSGRTQGFATRFDLACDGDRLVVVDPTHATLWDLSSAPRRVWTTALPARRTPVGEGGGQLAIECGAARIDGDDVVVDALRLGLADGALRPRP